MANDRSSIGKDEWKTSDLLSLSRQFIFVPILRSLFGDIESNSMIEADYYTFDEKVPHLAAMPFVSMCRLFFRSAIDARSRLAKYFIEHTHPMNESKVMDSYTTCLINHRPTYSEADYGLSVTSVLFASVGNTGPTTFWSLYYILRDPRALKTIKEEIECYLPKFDLDLVKDEGISMDDSISECLSKCVNLESAINETLRLMLIVFLMRRSKEETEIKLHDERMLHVKRGDRFLLYTATSHHSDELFSNPETFQFDRFLSKNVDLYKGFMPFGSGKHMCPGRHFAKNVIKMTVALILLHVEYEFLDPNINVEVSRSRIGLGVASPDRNVPIRYRYKS